MADMEGGGCIVVATCLFRRIIEHSQSSQGYHIAEIMEWPFLCDLCINTQNDTTEQVFESTYPNRDHPYFINTNDAKLCDQNYNVFSHCAQFE